ncbi:MAG: nucleotidyltransferase domain-containing protein [Magnetococcales bacterium]|nr:nucleotidyltransferase domain-containing protein [Magnetococcales bacterium]NGZ28049.1 nucleotidyltransferase domain-containing protein [Magnetococcales bacterium]
MNWEVIIHQLLNNLPHLLAIYAFGSRMNGHAGVESDLDLAVLSEGKSNPVLLWHLAGELSELAGCPVDLVDLRAASTVMQYQIITTGQRIWSQDYRASLYESFILSAKTSLNEARAPILQRILDEGVIHGR